MSASGSLAALFSHSSVTAAIAREADDSTLSLRGLGLKRQVSRIADPQISENQAKLTAANGQLQTFNLN
jgi:hypothetical protein